MDIIEDISSDILTNALKNLSPEDKVSYFVHSVIQTETTVMIKTTVCQSLQPYTNVKS